MVPGVSVVWGMCVVPGVSVVWGMCVVPAGPMPPFKQVRPWPHHFLKLRFKKKLYFIHV